MKVLHILNTGSYSGAENVVISIINHMSSSVESVYVSLDGTIRDVLKKNGINFHSVTKLSIKEIRMVIHEEKPDLIHAHDFTAGIISSVSAGTIPVISHLHNNPPWIKKINLKTICYALSCMRYQRIFTVSDAVVNEFWCGRLLKKKAYVIGNPICVSDIKEKVKVAKRKDSFDILFLGRLTEQKAPEFFLQIVSEVKKRIPTVSVGIVGDGELKERVIERISSLELEENVHCLGFIDNPYGIIEQSKILCIPSRWEGFGLVAIEALSLGKPIVAANVGGLPGIVTEESGKVCTYEKEYIDEIYELLVNSKYYGQKSCGASNRAEALDNSSKYFFNIEKEYKKLQERKK